MTNEMSVQDVIKNSYEIKQSGDDWKRVYIAMHQLSQGNQFRLIRNGDTIFAIFITAPHEASVMAFNAEKSFKNYIRNIREFAKSMDIAGYTKVVAKGVNVQVANALKHAGYMVELEPIAEDNGIQYYVMTATKGEE